MVLDIDRLIGLFVYLALGVVHWAAVTAALGDGLGLPAFPAAVLGLLVGLAPGLGTIAAVVAGVLVWGWSWLSVFCLLAAGAIAISLVHPALLDTGWADSGLKQPARRLSARVTRRLPPLLDRAPSPSGERRGPGGEAPDPA